MFNTRSRFGNPAPEINSICTSQVRDCHSAVAFVPPARPVEVDHEGQRRLRHRATAEDADAARLDQAGESLPARARRARRRAGGRARPGRRRPAPAPRAISARASADLPVPEAPRIRMPRPANATAAAVQTVAKFSARVAHRRAPVGFPLVRCERQANAEPNIVGHARRAISLFRGAVHLISDREIDPVRAIDR